MGIANTIQDSRQANGYKDGTYIKISGAVAEDNEYLTDCAGTCGTDINILYDHLEITYNRLVIFAIKVRRLLKRLNNGSNRLDDNSSTNIKIQSWL